MVGVFRDQHMCHHLLRGQAALDQPGRRRRLHHRALAGAAAVFRTASDNDLIAHRDHVETLAAVLADDVHRLLAARADCRFRLDHHLDPRQMRRQSTAAPSPHPATREAHLRVRLLRFGVAFGHRLFEVLQRQRQLVGVELLRAPAELHPLQLADEVAQALVLILDAATFGALGGELRVHRQHRGA